MTDIDQQTPWHQAMRRLRDIHQGFAAFSKSYGTMEHDRQTVTRFVVAAYKARDWEPLGYASWDAYVAGEIDTDDLKVSKKLRGPIIHALREEGMSTRAIGTIVSVNQSTVVRELASGDASASPEPETSGDATASPEPKSTPKVRGIDGKSYAARHLTVVESAEPEPAEAAPEPVQSSQCEYAYCDGTEFRWRGDGDDQEVITGLSLAVTTPNEQLDIDFCSWTCAGSWVMARADQEAVTVRARRHQETTDA